MSKRLQITLTDKGYEEMMQIINEYFGGAASKSSTIECAIVTLKKYLDDRHKK